MMPLIPAAIAVTMLISFIVSMSSPAENSHNRVIAANLLLQHEMAVKAVLQESIQSGDLSGRISGPFTDMGDWRTEVLPGSDQIYIVTWSGPDRPISDRTVIEAFAQITIADLNRIPNSASGFRKDVDGGEKIGRITLDGINIPVGQDEPVLVTVLSERGAG